MAVTYANDPSPYNLAYGINPWTLTGIDTVPGAIKYVFQIWSIQDGMWNTPDQLLADLRQSPNSINWALFDVQNILQSYVHPPEQPIYNASAAGLVLADGAFRYVIKLGSENAAGVVTLNANTYGPYTVYPGRKNWNNLQWGELNNQDEEWQYLPFQAVLSTEGSGPVCTTVTQVAKPLTDRPISTQPATGGRPSFLGIGDTIIDIKIRDKYVPGADTDGFEDLTMSYFSPLYDPSNLTLNKGIAAFAYEFFDGNLSYGVGYVQNILSNGGGPATVINENVNGASPAPGLNGQYSAITFNASPRNFGGLGPTTAWTHYYVWPVAYNACELEALPVTQEATHYPIRVEYVEPKCNDYDQLIQFKWMNSLGFWDYFTFTKRHERSVNINKNTFYKEEWDYNTAFSAQPFKQGGYTVYSQTLEQVYTATTDWLTDEEAKYLENLFISAKVVAHELTSNTPSAYTQQWLRDDVVILSKSYTQKTYRKDKLFQYEIQYKKAHNIKSQRG